ncbi:MAG: 7-cyano-7-deazaguanine synthase [Deltaproteobacteria bacterium]|jgi:7-cyano-7-deazaguanine synthase|nr:7-cyano-7-deazaguanine synthase [Deltaproteobacteria bacterium]
MSAIAASLSGGLDSTVLCAMLLAERQHRPVLPVFFRYGAKHGPWEEEAARRVAEYFSLQLTLIDLSAAFSHTTSALLAADKRPIPKAGYDRGSMAHTLVPGRNLIFASFLAAVAESRQAGALALATHAGDHCLYPDCRPAFNAALAGAIMESSEGKVRLLTPFDGMDKSAIVARGIGLGVPFALTRSCYENQAVSCGVCGTCRERLAAFAANGIADPLAYANMQARMDP